MIGGVSGLGKVAMTVAITRKELGASELRREAVRCPEANAIPAPSSDCVIAVASEARWYRSRPKARSRVP